MSNSNQLVGWKAIAGYLGVGIRTAQEYEKRLGLPVRHLAGEKGRVFANIAELDQWRATCLNESNGKRGDERPAAESSSVDPSVHSGVGIPSNWRMLVLLGTVAAALTTTALVWARLSPGPPAGFRVTANTLIVTDVEGREAWRYAFPTPLEKTIYTEPEIIYHRNTFVDLDADGRKELLFVDWPATPGRVLETPLYCFSSRGRVKWQFRPGRTVSDVSDRFPPPYFISNVHVLPKARHNQTLIAVSSNHYLEYPDQIAILDSAGKTVGEYWHSGHLLQLAHADLNHDGTEELLAAGVDNGRHQACLLVFDSAKVHGAIQYEPGNKFQMQGFGPGTETATVLFPRSDVTRQRFNEIFNMTVADNRIMVCVTEGESPENTAVIMYELDYALNVVRVAAGPGFLDAHQRLRSADVVDHDYTEAERLAWQRAVVVRRAK